MRADQHRLHEQCCAAPQNDGLPGRIFPRFCEDAKQKGGSIAALSNRLILSADQLIMFETRLAPPEISRPSPSTVAQPLSVATTASIISLRIIYS